MDRLGRSSNAYKAEGPFWRWRSEVPVDFSSAENQIHPDDAVGESDFQAIKGVKCQIPVFDGKKNSWRHFEMEFLMAVRHLRLDSALASDKEGIPVADRTISRDRLHAHYGNSKVAKHFVMWSLISSSLKTDADKRVVFSTKLPVASWDRVVSFCRAETQGA